MKRSLSNEQQERINRSHEEALRKRARRASASASASASAAAAAQASGGPAPSEWIYVLELEHNCIYVGKTKKVND